MPPSCSTSAGAARADEVEVVGVHEDRHALALDEAAQRAAHDVHDALRVGVQRAGEGLLGDAQPEVHGRALDGVGDLVARGGEPFRGGRSRRRGRRRAMPGASALPAAKPSSCAAARMASASARACSSRLSRTCGVIRGIAAVGLEVGQVEGDGVHRVRSVHGHQMTSSSWASSPRPSVIAARLLEAADGGDDPALGLLDDGATLRRGGLEVLAEHLGAALGHVGEDLLGHVGPDAAQREPEVLLVDLAQHELDVAVVEDHDVVEREEPLADLVGQLLVVFGDGLQDVALGASARRG